MGAMVLALVFVLACGLVGAVVGYGAWFAWRLAVGGGGDFTAGDMLLHLGYLGGGFAGLLAGISLASRAWERVRAGPTTERD